MMESSFRYKMALLTYGYTLRLLIMVVLSIFSLTILINSFGNLAHAASPGSIVITEIMYNPSSGNQDDEFLEIYNASDSTIDLNGWYFSNGIDLTFSNSTLINAGEYAIVSPSILQTQTTYSKTPIAIYNNTSLSNSGETLTLKDNIGNIISSVTYDDSPPWPLSPDGNGPSLELKNLNANTLLSSSWGASLNDHGTPGEVNSINDLNLPLISNVTIPGNVSENQQITINANISNEDNLNVTLQYLVNFDTYIDLEMFDDGNHEDGLASDNIYGASIPGQPAGTLVRYSVIASNNDGAATMPSNEDSQDYYSYIVDDGTQSDIPILRWYMDPDDFDDMTTNHLSDDLSFPAVVSLGDQIFDNSRVRVKGGSSVNFAKRKYKFDLPSGYTVQQAGFESGIDEFSIQTYFLNLSEIPEKLVNKVLDRYEEPTLFQRYVRVHKNDIGPSDFYGHYLFTETYDDSWRDKNGYNTGALYKEATEKKTRTDEDSSDIDSLINNLTTLSGEELKRYIYNNIDIANIINYNAIMAVIRNDDWFTFHNQYQYRDTEGSQRWQYLAWDNDNSFMTVYFDGIFAYTRSPIISPLPSNQSLPPYQYRLVERAMFQFKEFEDMYYRRVATIYDDLYGSDLTKQWYEELYTASYQTLVDDMQKWGDSKQELANLIFGTDPFDLPDDLDLGLTPSNIFSDGTPEDIKAIFDYGEDEFKNQMDQLRISALLPPSQQLDAFVEIYEPKTINNIRYIEIYNTLDSAIDLSGWTIPELNFNFKQGSVIPANSTAYITEDDVLFRQTKPEGYFVIGTSQDWPQKLDSIRLLNNYNNEVFKKIFNTQFNSNLESILTQINKPKNNILLSNFVATDQNNETITFNSNCDNGKCNSNLINNNPSSNKLIKDGTFDRFYIVLLITFFSLTLFLIKKLNRKI